jgi:hypothetical protein
MKPNAYTTDEAGILSAEKDWAEEATAGTVRFGIDKKSKRLVVIPNTHPLFKSSYTYNTPAEAEHAVIGKEPTRSAAGRVVGAAFAPRSQYQMTNPVTGQAGDPIRTQQRSTSADVAQDITGAMGHYAGPIIAAAKPLSKKVIPGAAMISAGTDLANNIVGAVRDDALYNESAPNALLTAAAAAGGTALVKHFSDAGQVQRELDEIIRRKMRLGKKGQIDPTLRQNIMDRFKAGEAPYTLQEWRDAPLMDFPTDPKLPSPQMTLKRQPPVMAAQGSKVLSRKGKNLIDEDVTIKWLQAKGINPQSVDVAGVQKALSEAWYHPKRNLGMMMFPTKETPAMNHRDYVKQIHSLRSEHPAVADIVATDAEMSDPVLNEKWKGALVDWHERRAKLPNSKKKPQNRGRATGTGEIVSQKEYESAGKPKTFGQKWGRRLGRAGGFALPVATELFGKYILPTGRKTDE